MQTNKPKYTTSIVSVRAGEVIPDTFLHKLLDENRSAIGFVVQDGKKLEVEKFATLADTEKEIANIKDILGNTKKFQRMFIFHSFPAEYDEDEIQPWTIIKDSKGSPLLVVAIEGDLPGKDVDGSSEMLGTINEYLGPKIEALFTLVGNDPKKLFAALKDQKAFGADLMNIIGHRAHFYFMPAEGDIFAHGKESDAINPLAGVFSWGSASNAYGYTESAIAAATVVEAAAAAPAVKKSKYASVDPEPAPSKVDDKGIHHIKPAEPKPAVEVPKVTPVPSSDPIQNAAKAAIAETRWEPPKNVHGKKLKQLYRSVNDGVLPNNWEQRPSIMIKTQTVIKDLKDLAQTAVANLPASQVVKVEKVENVLPVIGGKQQGEIKEWIKKYLDGSSNKIDNPLDLQKQESQLAVFSELCLKNGLDEFETWPTSVVAAFCKTFPDGAWLLLLELRKDRIARKQMSKLGDVKLGELTGTEAAPVTAPVVIPPTPTPTSPVHVAPAAPVHRKSKYA